MASAMVVIYEVVALLLAPRVAGLAAVLAIAGLSLVTRPIVGALVTAGMMAAILPASAAQMAAVACGASMLLRDVGLAPVVEETLKPVGAGLLIQRWKAYIHSGSIGLIYGALSGLGFGLAEALIVSPTVGKFMLRARDYHPASLRAVGDGGFRDL